MHHITITSEFHKDASIGLHRACVEDQENKHTKVVFKPQKIKDV